MDGRYYVYIMTDKERGCFYYDNKEEAISRYKATEMHKLSDNVFLGCEGNGFCFDIVHKFFENNVLINDYLNHEGECEELVLPIIDALVIRYQFTSDLLGGVLINYGTPFVQYDKQADEGWAEAYVSTWRNDALEIVGWVKHSRDAYDNYGWNYPTTASYISIINASVYTNNGRRRYVDMDARAYLLMLGKKVSIAKEDK